MTKWSNLFLASTLAAAACGQADDDDAQPTPAADVAKDVTEADAKPEPKPTPPKDKDPVPKTDPPVGEQPGPREVCVPPADVSNDPQSIAQVIDLINALPRPVTISCFVEVLRRPLRFNATTSKTSVQPAVNEKFPRVFLFSGPSLIITFVPAGIGSEAIEFSQLVNNATSVKAEIGFPVERKLAGDAGFESILKDDRQGTTCSACHAQEAKAGLAYGDKAFMSRAFRPVPTKDVPLIDFRIYADTCEGDQTESCQIVRGILDHGDVLPHEFPADMPVLF